MFEWIVGIVESGGYLGVAFLMLVENVFPPIPSELIMPLAGFVAARGDLDPALVVLAGTFGSVLGTLPWYFAGRLLGEKRLKQLAGRYGRWLTMNAADIDTAMGWFHRHGRLAVLLGRLIPTVRTLISVPAGIARMAMPPFLLYSTVGSLLWTAALAAAGFLLESQYQLVADYLDVVTKIVVGLIVLVYLYRLATWRR